MTKRDKTSKTFLLPPFPKGDRRNYKRSSDLNTRRHMEAIKSKGLSKESIRERSRCFVRKVTYSSHRLHIGLPKPFMLHLSFSTDPKVLIILAKPHALVLVNRQSYSNNHIEFFKVFKHPKPSERHINRLNGRGRIYLHKKEYQHLRVKKGDLVSLQLMGLKSVYIKKFEIPELPRLGE